MACLTVNTSTGAYPIHIGENIRNNVLNYIKKNYSAILIITDKTVANLYLSSLLLAFENERNVHHVILEGGEASKNIDSYYALQTKALELGLDRQSLIIAFGGGVIGDVAGFVAATFMRGVDYIQMPTTILAHDSSVGGKVAINHERGKNMIGNFYQPKAVIYDIATLHSLPKHEVRSGFAELVKEAFIANESFLNNILKSDVTTISNDQLTDYLINGIEVKREIVEADEKEANIRAFLNFGHTLAHALENSLGYGEITHGEAVAIGMVFALKLSEKQFNVTLPYDNYIAWLKKNSYPLSLFNIEIEKLITAMKLDKKSTHNKVQMVLLKNVAQPTVVTIDESVLNKELQSFAKEWQAT